MPGNPLTDPNWAKDLADTIERFVAKVRSTVTDRLVVAVRAVVFGLVIAIAAPVTLILLIILATKLLQRLIDLATDHDSSVWISYAGIGGLLVLLGSLMMRKRYTVDDA
ncbi:MAG TPA: hypothetical protein VLD86_12580 [Ilumatobacteraceae bacterium]|nr:hypothetical protein [Ilumatobacteraceae bacterium]